MRERAVCISVQDAFNFGDSGGRLRYFISLHRKSDITVTIACSQPGVYQVLLQNRGKSYFHRIKSLCASPFTTENICVKKVLALFARYFHVWWHRSELRGLLLSGYVYRSSLDIIYITVLYFLKFILLPSISVSTLVFEH